MPEVIFERTFPNRRRPVPEHGKFPVRLDITYNVVRKFVIPEFRIALGAARKPTAMLMPEASVHEHDYPIL